MCWMLFQPMLAAMLVIGLVRPPTALAVITVGSADEVCGPTVDPCNINQVVKIAPGSPPLDFGTRSIRMGIGGQFDVGSGTASVLCGSFLATLQGNVAIKVINADVGGVLTLTALGSCTGDGTLACLTDRSCLDAGAGTCDTAGADITLAGRVKGRGVQPGSLFLRAAGAIVVNDTVDVSGTTGDSDGGTIDLSSFDGDITVKKPLLATGGSASSGGDISIDSGADVLVTDVIDVTGGDFDGGTVDITASGDIRLRADIRAGANGGSGFGGEVSVDAGGGLVIDGGSGGKRQLIRTDGSGPFEQSGGDGGSQCYDAVGDITVGDFVRLEADGAAPDGFGDEIDLTSAEGSVLLHGDINARAKGGQGDGGTVGLDGADRVETFPGSVVDVTAPGASGTEEIFVFAGGDFVHGGVFNVVAASAGLAGDIAVRSSGNVTVTGTMMNGGDASGGGLSGLIAISGCVLTFAPGAVVSNASEMGRNTLTAREQIVVQFGATLTQSGTSGTNDFVYRTPVKPPLLSGAISPPPLESVNSTLPVCPVCANGVVEPGESCDDRNLVDGDGCSSQCQDEACIAATPGFPAVALCNDGNGCTTDACDGVAHQCTHTVSCDDGIGCTIDACMGIVCGHTPSAALCEDGNPCTAHSCSTSSGCGTAAIPGVCDDGLSCTSGDSCLKGVCSGTPNCPSGETCNVALNACVAAATTTTSTTTTTTTTTTTSTTTSTSTTTLGTGGGCGDGIVQSGEECDNAASNGIAGSACGSQCHFRVCGDANGVGGITASDALFALQAAVGSVVCAPCVCDVAAVGKAGVTASDALVLLRRAVGIPGIVLQCPVCR